MDKVNGCIFWLKVMTYQKNIMLFAVKSVLMSKKNLITRLSTKIFFLKTKIKSYSDEVTDFYDKEIPKVDSNLTCLVVKLDSTLNKGGNYYR